MSTEASEDNFDGIYFIPSDEENEVSVAFFKFKEDDKMGEKVGSSEMGDMFHIALFKTGEDGIPEFDGDFEAILVDPITYIKSVTDMQLYGCLLRKTEKSGNWWSDYLTKTQESCRMYQS